MEAVLQSSELMEVEVFGYISVHLTRHISNSFSAILIKLETSFRPFSANFDKKAKQCDLFS